MLMRSLFTAAASPCVRDGARRRCSLLQHALIGRSTRRLCSAPPPVPRKPLTGLASHVFAASVGLVAGGSIGLVGFGGAQFIIPGMTHPLLGLSQLSASGVSLASLSVSTVTSGASFVAAGCAALPVAAVIALPSMVSARVFTRLAARLSGDALALFFNGFSVILMMVNLIVATTAHGKEQPHTDPQAVALTRRETAAHESTDLSKFWEHALFGVCSGGVSALMGVGGLPLTISYLTVNTDLSHHLVQGTAVCSAAPAVLVSALSRAGSIPIATAVAVAVGASVGASLGAHAALSLKEAHLRVLYMVALAGFGGSSSIRAVANVRALLAARRNTTR